MGKKKGTKGEKTSTKDPEQSDESQQQQEPKKSKTKGSTSAVPVAKPALSSVSEASVEENGSEERKSERKEKQKKEQCPDEPTETSAFNFGVRSYLHHFYESVNQPYNSQGEDYHYLIHPKNRRCGPLWFKIGLIIGSTLFLMGAVTIVIGYAIPKQITVVGRTGNLEVIDNEAGRFNENLDRCKLIGLAGFCSGGLVLVISLLAPTFASTYWDDDPAIEPFRVSLTSALITDSEPKSPIPVTEKIKCVQPTLTDEGCKE